jgi:hypothetical protein
MDKQDIIRMSREAREQVAKELPPNTFDLDLFHERFAALVASRVAAAAVEQERKEFAVHAIDIARKAIEEERDAIIDLVATYGGPVDLEAAIRARGEMK